MPDSKLTSSIIREHKKEVFLLLLLGSLFSYVYISSPPEVELFDTYREPEYTLQLKNIEIEDHWLEKKRWKIFGKTASIPKDNKKVILTDVKILVYRSSNLSELDDDVIITSNSGELNWNNQSVTLSSNVQMHQGSEISLNTEYAVYNYEEGILNMPQKVNIRYFEATIKGNQLTYSVPLQNIELHDITWKE